MVGARSPRGGGFLSSAVGRGSCDSTLVPDDRGGADRGNRRSPGDYVSDPRGGGHSRADDRARGSGASELPDVVCSKMVVLVQFGMPHLLATPDSTTATRIALWGGREVVMLVLASLIAGLATTPYAAFHFHRVAPYGVLANLAAMPVVSALVMPAGLLGLLAVPFGFDGFFWWLMGVGIDWMIAVARWVDGPRGLSVGSRRSAPVPSSWRALASS